MNRRFINLATPALALAGGMNTALAPFMIPVYLALRARGRSSSFE
jgi:hypothetical protein